MEADRAGLPGRAAAQRRVSPQEGPSDARCRRPAVAYTRPDGLGALAVPGWLQSICSNRVHSAERSHVQEER